MKLGYDLTIEQTQKLSMTPELIQAIQILQFNTQELDAFLQEELLENPVLEVGKIEEEVPTTSDEIINTDTLETEKPEDIEKEFDLREKIKEAEYDDISYKQWEYSKKDNEYTFEQFVSEEKTLQDILLDQLNFSKLKESELVIGRYIVEAIDENGYLTFTAEEVATQLNVPVEKVEKVLDVIQTFEPIGVGARNLSECLIIQLAAKGLLTEEIEYVLTNQLCDLANNKIATISKAVGLSIADAQDICDLIKTLEPKPGRQYSANVSTRYIVPDVFVEKINDEYYVSSNDSSIPKLMVSSYYGKLTEEAGKDPELSKYLNDKFNSAIWLIKSIEQRKHTIFNVASAIVKYQNDFFDNGAKFLKTLTLKQIADEIGVHESTVSRSINGKYMQTPRGVFEMKYFFSSGVSGEDGNGISSNSIKSFIKDIIDKENLKKPSSDQDIAEILSDKGIEISRRTVAKYREGMNIQSSSKRRRY